MCVFYCLRLTLGVMHLVRTQESGGGGVCVCVWWWGGGGGGLKPMLTFHVKSDTFPKQMHKMGRGK